MKRASSLLLITLLALLPVSGVWAQEGQSYGPSHILLPEKTDVSPPLRSIKPIPPRPGTWERPEHRVPDWVNQPPVPPKPFEGVHVLQNAPAPPKMPAPLLTFEGVGEGLSGYTVNVAPPDTTGDIGPNHYVQWVNLHFAIFDRNGNLLYGPAAGNTLWSGFGGRCETDNDGDPIVQYDQFADRWVMTQFAVSTSPYYQCIAVSVTNDPLGSWYRYAYSFGTNMNDYPKFGVWVNGANNSYVGTYNMFLNGSTFSGAEICAYNRQKMLAGDATAEGVCFGPYSSYASILPADVDGPEPAPLDSPNYLLARSGTNALLFWRLTMNWSVSPPTGTLTGPTTISVASFSGACSSSNWTCISQPGTTQKLDSLGDRLMYRLAYRNFGSFENLVVNHSINSAEPIAVRWYELRNLAGTPTVYQSGTYQPTSDSRWMGSAAMDAEGNLAIGFSISNGTAIYPSIAYAGRLVSDPLGQLSQGEATMYSGSGSQTGVDRWGDYSTLSIDPVDECTFWFTTEYLATTGSYNWHTRIGTFRFPQVKPGPTLSAVANGNNRVDLSWSSVAGATRYFVFRANQSGGPYTRLATITAPVTTYSDPTVQGGITYYYKVGHNRCTTNDSNEASVTAQGPCTAPPTFAGLASVSTPNNATCKLNLAWTAATAQCGGPVTYSVYRSTTSPFTPSAANRIATSLTTTNFTDQNGLVNGTTYYYIVRATDQSNGVEDTNTVTKSAAPYGVLSNQVLLTENFDSLPDGGFPSGWATGFFAGDANDWRGAQACTAHSGTKILRCGGNKCDNNYGNSNHAFTRTAAVTVPAGAQNTRLSFWHRWYFQTNYDGGYLRVSLNGTTYIYVSNSAILSGGYNNTNIGWWDGDFSTNFTNTVVNLDAACNAASGGSDGCQGRTVYVAFVEYTNLTTAFPGWYIDDVVITADVPASCSATPEDVLALTATATSNQVKLEWVNPYSGGYGSTRICWSTTGFPTDPTACGSNFTDKAGTAGAYDSFVHTGLTNNTTYYYTAFVNNGAGVFSDGRSVQAKPFATTGPVKWGYSTAATSLAPPGLRPGALGTGAIYAVSNDRVAHAMNVTSSGGDWPRTGSYSWAPAAMNGPVQARPPVVPATFGAVSQWLFLGCQDGHAYGVNAHTGQVVWQSAQLGEVVQANPSGLFTKYGGAWDLLFVGTRNATSGNTMYALNPATGATVWSFNNGGGSSGIGIISSAATVDYANKRLYFSSRSRGGGSADTLWCLSFTNTLATKLFSLALGDSDAAPVLVQGRVYVGNNAGEVRAVDAATGTVLWTYATGDGPVKGFVHPTFTALPRRLYFSTTNRVWSLTDNGGSASLNFSLTSIPNPSPPLLNPNSGLLYLGAGDGRLYELDPTTQAVKFVALPTGTVSGTPSLDVSNQLVLVGNDLGTVHAVAVPLP